MTDPRKQFDTHKTVRMTYEMAEAIELEAKRRKMSEGEVMRRWIRRGVPLAHFASEAEAKRFKAQCLRRPPS